MKQLLTLALCSLLLWAPQCTAQLFQSQCDSLAQWDVLDLGSTEAQCYPTADLSCPQGYGPEVLHLKAGHLLLLAKAAPMEEGTFVALYHENEVNKGDSDGVLFFWADYPADIEKAHNLKEKRAHVWMQQGREDLSLRRLDSAQEESTLAKTPGMGSVKDEWNRTGWIWQKAQLKKDTVRIKFWPAHLPEPASWTIESKTEGARKGRFGVRLSSADIQLAWFAADSQDIPIPAPPAYLYFPHREVVQTRTFPLNLFLNTDAATTNPWKGIVLSGDMEFPIASFSATGAETALLLTTRPEATSFEGVECALPQELEPGICQIKLSSASGLKATASFEIKPAGQVQQKLDDLRVALAAFDRALANIQENNDRTAVLLAMRDAVSAHLDHAQEVFLAGESEEADHILRFASETLAELQGYKGDWIKALAPDFSLPECHFTYDPKDRRRIKEDEKKSDFYTMAYGLRFGVPTLSSQSFVMGNRYKVAIPWTVDKATPDRDFKISYLLESPLGIRVVARSQASDKEPTSQWEAGKTYTHHITLNVLAEINSDKRILQSQPQIIDEYHRLLVQVKDPESGVSVLLENPIGPQADRMGRRYCLETVYISSSPVEIRNFAPQSSQVLQARSDSFRIKNLGKEPFQGRVLFKAITQTGRIAFQELRDLSLKKRATLPLQFDWTPRYFGDITLKVEVLKGSHVATEAQRTIALEAMNGNKVKVIKQNHVEQESGRFFTPIQIQASQGPISAKVYAAGRLVAEGQSESATLELQAEPWFGYYDVELSLGEAQYSKRLVATVSETQGRDLLVNGEPFIVKGVNVHGLYGASPAFTETLMRTMRKLGFNTWRTDYPALWQVDLAYKTNSAYTVLAPFSCTLTPEIFGRQVGPPMATARELSRMFIQRYRDHAGVLCWNSCNEIRGETEDFLSALYPLYKHLDPYNRPVHYANLQGQYYYQGQDIMGMNHYFMKGTNAKSTHKPLLVNLNVAKEQNMPIFFNEYNSWHGAVPTSGVDALEHMYQWSLDQGSIGGFQYQDNNSDRHPGVYDELCNTHKIYDEALIDTFADAAVSLVEKADRELVLQIPEQTPLSSAGNELDLELDGQPLETPALEDLTPEASHQISLNLPESLTGPNHQLEGLLTFTTHFGFHCEVPVKLYF